MGNCRKFKCSVILILTLDRVKVTSTYTDSTCRTTCLPNHVIVAARATEIWPFEFRHISTLDEVEFQSTRSSVGDDLKIGNSSLIIWTKSLWAVLGIFHTRLRPVRQAVQNWLIYMSLRFTTKNTTTVLLKQKASMSGSSTSVRNVVQILPCGFYAKIANTWNIMNIILIYITFFRKHL